MQIKNKKLEAIALRASEDLPQLVAESEKNIMEAWTGVTEESQLNDTTPKLRLSFTIILDLDKSIMDTTLAFGVRHTLTRSGKIPDPNQPALPNTN